MQRLVNSLILLGALVAAISLASSPAVVPVAARTGEAVAAPELPVLPRTAWLNSAPLTLASLRGRPVLVEFWTFDCSNCRATLPWLKQVHDKYGPRGLQVIGVHSPEFDHERDAAAVARHVRELGIHYAVLVDNDFRYWNALGNRFWPAFYLIDPQGRLVETRIGELHSGEVAADGFERAIAAYLP